MHNNIDFEVNKIKILKDDNYIIWLNDFINKYPIFNSKGTRKKGLSEKDKENIKLLKFFYGVVENYAKSNFITCNTNQYGDSYGIKYNDLCFEIVKVEGKTTFYFCNKVDEDAYSMYVNYNNIKINKISNKKEKIEDLRKDFENLVEILYDNNFSLEDINKITKDVIKRKSLTRF